MLPMRDYAVEMERRKDEMAYARRNRLIAGVGVKPSWRVGENYRRIMVRLGEMLELWGCQLQSRTIGKGPQTA